MIATIINVALILLGSVIGLCCKNLISERFSQILTQGMALCVLGIGISSAVAGEDALCTIICIVVGTLIGEAAGIEDKLDGIGSLLQKKLVKEGESSRFTEGFVTATVLYCVGAMAITGSINAGLNQDYTVLVSKGVIDGVTSISYAATLGIGVAFSAVPLFLYQGGLTLLASWVGPYLSDAVIVEMSAVGGTIIVGIALNMLGVGKDKIRVGNMLPAIFLPLVYLPLADWCSRLLF